MTRSLPTSTTCSPGAQSSPRGLRASTRAKKLASLSSFYTFCTRRRVLDVSPMFALNLPETGDGRTKRAWTAEEMYAFFAEIPAEGGLLAMRDRALFWLLFRNGLRVSEAIGADVGDLVIKQGTRVLEIVEHGVEDEHIKGGRARDAILKPATVETLDVYLAARGIVAGAELEGTPGEWRSWPLFIATRVAGRIPAGGRRAISGDKRR